MPGSPFRIRRDGPFRWRDCSCGPVVASFYRGDWCDYCAMELAALSAVHDQMKELGASLIGISPQAPEARIRCDDPKPPFPLLFDAGAKVARRCRIAFTLSDELRPIYTQAGYRPSANRCFILLEEDHSPPPLMRDLMG